MWPSGEVTAGENPSWMPSTLMHEVGGNCLLNLGKNIYRPIYCPSRKMKF